MSHCPDSYRESKCKDKKLITINNRSIMTFRDLHTDALREQGSFMHMLRDFYNS